MMLTVLSFLIIQLLLAADQYQQYLHVCTDEDCNSCLPKTKQGSVSSKCEPISCGRPPFSSVWNKYTCEKVTAKACCDPHFKMWDYKHFSFHGECDLVIFSNPTFASGAGIVIQIRTEIKTHYSFIKNLAIKVGDQYFEIEERSGPGVNYYYNGYHYEQPLNNFAGYHVRKVENATWCKGKCSQTEILNFDFQELGSVELGDRVGKLYVTLSIKSSWYNNSIGLFGKWGEHGFVARNGTILQNADLHGKEWQVLDTEPMLFHEMRYPQYPEKCIMPNPTSRRMVDEETRRVAEKACAHLSGPVLDMCIYDVQVTGDVRMAISPMYV